jgi:hypothetical protein
MNIDQRDEEIWRLRREGATFPQIARRFHLSPSRVQQIYCWRKDKMENFDKWPPLKRALPVRVQNILIKAFGSEEIFKNPEKLASMGPKVFMAWRNMGRKGVNQLIEALESLGYAVNGNMKMTDSRCEVYLKIGRSILLKYFDYYKKNSMDDAEYIPTVRVIIEGIIEEMKSSGMGEPNCNALTEKLKAFNRSMYQNIWIEHAKEDEEPEDEEPLDLGKECQLAEYTFDYIYKHGEHPK